MNSRGATTVKGLNLASTNISGPSSVQRDRREYGQACADVERNNHRIISRDSSDDLSHVDLKSHVPYSTEEVQKAPERAIERLKRNHKIKKKKTFSLSFFLLIVFILCHHLSLPCEGFPSLIIFFQQQLCSMFQLAHRVINLLPPRARRVINLLPPR